MPRRSAVALTLLLLATGCYGTPRGPSHTDGGAGSGPGGTSGRSGSGAGGMAGASLAGAGGTGASAGTGGSAGSPLIGGSAGSAKGGASGSGVAGIAGSGGSGGTANGGVSGPGAAGIGPGGVGGAAGASSASPVFVSGPCVAGTGALSVEVFARANDGSIYRRPYDGSIWTDWSALLGLGETTDVRSDVDCSVSTDGKAVHLVATGLNPVGALLHSFGFGNTYNRFTRELGGQVFDPSPAISAPGQAFGAVFGGWPKVYQLGDQTLPQELSPVTTFVGSFNSAPDIANQPFGGSGLILFAAFEDTGELSIYSWMVSSGGFGWLEPVKLKAPSGTFAFSPTICTENGGWGISSVNVAAVSGGKLWYARTDSITSTFSSWTKVSDEVASSPDCSAGGPESVVHVVALSAKGTVLDIHGKGTNWATTDLGRPQ